MQSEFENILLDTQKEYRRSNRMKDKIIVVLIVLMFLEAIIGYCGFVWYESQFDYVTTEQTTQDIDLSTEGDNASAEYNDVHHKILPTIGCSGVNIIPKEWERHTTHDIDDSVIPKYTKMALKTYYEWETETKELYKELCNKLLQMGEHSDYEFLKELVLDVEKEIKKIMRLYENLNGTGYDVNAIQSVQDKYHEKYKKKYNDRFTTKNNYRQTSPYSQYDGEESRTRRIGFQY